MRVVIAIAALALLSLNAHAGLNKWVDAEGKVHYSDTPPPETETQSVPNVAGKDSGATPAASSTPKSYAEREAELRKAKQSKDEAAQKKAQETAAAESKRSNCAAARESLRTLEAGGRLITYDANGERVFIDDAARAQRIEEANKAISANCN